MASESVNAEVTRAAAASDEAIDSSKCNNYFNGISQTRVTRASRPRPRLECNQMIGPATAPTLPSA
uniref:Uncharacterized protein n=1 Tax=Pristionchus pacificus TaxID=54126 RepID=A0A2A6CG06_PRIPA|eukprot:PDM77155.1 hypothetical protein PRIPAC_43067 [Pristionchus pacificus]